MIAAFVAWIASVVVGALATSAYSIFVLKIDLSYAPGNFGISILYLLVYSCILLLPLFAFALSKVKSALIWALVLIILSIWSFWFCTEILWSFSSGDEALSVGYLVMIVSLIVMSAMFRFRRGA